MMVVSRHGELFDTMVRMDHPHVGIGFGDFPQPGVFERDTDGKIDFAFERSAICWGLGS
jgi:hypothetical protein